MFLGKIRLKREGREGRWRDGINELLWVWHVSIKNNKREITLLEKIKTGCIFR
jgi:hypothetical protein